MYMFGSINKYKNIKYEYPGSAVEMFTSYVTDYVFSVLWAVGICA